MNVKKFPPTLLAALLCVGLIAGCSSQALPTSAAMDAAPTIEATTAADAPSGLTPLSTEEAATECPGEEINPIGQSIAADYDFATYDQVMTWFCEGAEFEDILTALETQAVTDEPADEMLQMLADGLTWEDIWLLVGLEN